MLNIGIICKDRKNGKMVEVVNLKRVEYRNHAESYVVFKANINVAKGTYTLKEMKDYSFLNKYEIAK